MNSNPVWLVPYRKYTAIEVNKVAIRLPKPLSKFNLAMIPALFSIVVESPISERKAGVIIALAADCIEIRRTNPLGVCTKRIGTKITK
jgi:hypothetical protein